MLILDKRKAVDHIVALAAHLADAPTAPAASAAMHAGRFQQKVATFERRSAPREAASAKRSRRPARRRGSSRQLSPA